MNGPTAPATATVRQETSRRPSTGWELSELLRPLPAVERPPRKYRPQQLRHYAAVVEYVYKSRFATCSQVQRKFPTWIRSERTAQYQLARLVELGYLDTASARSTSPNFPYVYFATGPGVRLIRETYAEHGVTWHVSSREEDRERGRAVETLLHELMLTEFELAVRLTVDARPDLKILASERRYFREENRLVFVHQSRESYVEPDAGFVLAVERPGSDRALLLCCAELDLGGMSVRRILGKYWLYAHWGESAEGAAYLDQLYRRFGATNPQPNYRLLVLAHDARNPGKDVRRLQDLYAQALELPGPMRDRIWLTTVEQLRAHQADDPPLAAPLWYRARDARDWLADYRAHLAALPRSPGQKIQPQQRAFVAARLPSLPLHPLFPHPVAPPSP